MLTRVLCVFTFMLFLLTVALWLRSYFVADGVEWFRPPRQEGPQWQQSSWWIYSERGGIRIQRHERLANWQIGVNPDELGITYFTTPVSGYPTLAGRPQFMGFQLAREDIRIGTGSERRREFYFIAPWWAPTLLAALLCTWAIVLVRRRRARSPFTCIKCGYDVRASRERCPECGTGYSHEAAG